jgi:hypothetical protein
MIINDLVRKIKYFFEGETGRDVIVVLVIIVVSLVSFYLGRLSKTESKNNDIKVTYETPREAQNAPNLVQNRVVETNVITPTSTSEKGNFVASKRGKKYYPVACSAANNLNPANKIYFATVEAALSAGYTLAASCK